METYVANIPKEAHVLALEDKSNKTADPAKRPAPMASGCRIEGFVRVKRVNELHLKLHGYNFVLMVDNVKMGVLLSFNNNLSCLPGSRECCYLSSIWLSLV